MDKQELYRQLARLESEMEDAYNCHDYDGYWDARGELVTLEKQYAHLLD